MRNPLTMLFGLLFVLVIPFTGNMVQPADDTVAIEEEADLEAQLEAINWLQLERIETLEADDTTTLMIYYITREVDPVAYRAEMLEVYRLLGTMPLPEAADQVAIIPMADMGTGLESIEAATVDTEGIAPYAEGDTSRTAFLGMMSFAPLEHFNNDTEEQSPA